MRTISIDALGRQYGKGLRVPHEYFRTKHGHLLIDVAEITE